MKKVSKIDTIKRLKAMAEQGTKNEQEIAMKKIELLMTKYNITEDSSNEIDMHSIKIRNETDRSLLNQIVYMIGERKINTYSWTRGRKKNTEQLVECTEAQYKEIMIAYEFYRDLLDEEKELLYLAFIHKHDIFPLNENTDGNKSTLSDEKIERMFMMMASLEDRHLHKMIEQKEKEL